MALITSGCVQHETVVTQLQQLMQQNPGTFMAPVLDALTNLNLHDDLMGRVHSWQVTACSRNQDWMVPYCSCKLTRVRCRRALPRLSSVDLADLPLLIKFLLHTAAGCGIPQHGL